MVNAKESLQALKRIEAELLLRSRLAGMSAEERYAAVLAWGAVHEEIEQFEEHRMGEEEE